MKNIILQHWAGPLNELTELSSANISKYATRVGAEYKLLRGEIFQPHLNLSAPCHKLFMLDESFDEYDTVVMLDADMFTRKGMEDNIFDPSITGVGMHTSYQSAIYQGLHSKHPTITNPTYAYWGGAIYKLSREMRQRLRVHINDKEIKKFSGQGAYEDEGIMHYLATAAKVFPTYLPGEHHWCCGNFELGVKTCAMIHIRHKIKDGNGKIIRTPKIEVYKDLVKRGLIEG